MVCGWHYHFYGNITSVNRKFICKFSSGQTLIHQARFHQLNRVVLFRNVLFWKIFSSKLDLISSIKTFNSGNNGKTETEQQSLMINSPDCLFLCICFSNTKCHKMPCRSQTEEECRNTKSNLIVAQVFLCGSIWWYFW